MLQLAIQAVAPQQGEANIYSGVDPCFLLTLLFRQGRSQIQPLRPGPSASSIRLRGAIYAITTLY